MQDRINNPTQAAVETDNRATTIYRFPSDLGSVPELPHRIKIDLIRRDGASFDPQKSQTSDFDYSKIGDFRAKSVQGIQTASGHSEFGEGLKKNLNAIKGTANAAIAVGLEEFTTLASGILNQRDFPKDASGKILLTQRAQENYTRVALNLLNNRETVQTSIELALPPQLSFSYGANWEGQSFSNIALTFDLLKSIAAGANFEQTKGAIRKTGRPILSNLAQSGQDLVATAIGLDSTDQGTISDLVSQQNRQVPNPLVEFLFRGVNNRSFEYTFNLMPRSAEEADTVRMIIQKLLESAHPSLDGEAAYLNYPDEVEISFLYKNVENEWIRKIQRCVITSVDLDLSPENRLAFFRGGIPAIIRFTVKFQEIVQMNRQLISRGY